MIAGGGVCNRCNVEGFGFYPNDEVLVRHLKRKICDPDSDRHYIGDEDLRKLEPSDLLGKTQKNPDGKEGYFFWWPTYKNNRIIRKGKNGYWGETRGCVPIDSGEDGVIAKKRVFVFFEGVYPGTRTAWFIYQFELELAIHQDKKEIFLCKLVEHEQKDRLSGSKRKAEHNVQETLAKPRRARKDGSLRKKAKFSGAQEAQIHDEHNNNNNIMSCEVLDGSRSLPSDPDSSILTGELTPQTHHLPSKDFSDNNMPEGGHHWSTRGLHPSNGFPGGDIQKVDDNQQCHHLPSNSISGFSTGVGIPSSTPEEISNIEDPQYNEKRNEESQLSFHSPLDPKNDIISSGRLQRSHHLPSNCDESIESFDACEKSQPKLPTREGGSLNCMDEETNYYRGISFEELLAQLEQPQPQPPTTAEVHGWDELPPITNLSRGPDQLQDQSGSNEEDDASFWDSFPSLY